MIKAPTRFCTDNAIKQLIDKYSPKNNATILDVGCGKGHYYQYFTSHTIKGSYLGIDIKEHETWQTKEENGMHISFLVYDAEKLQILAQKQKFDFIAVIQSFEHIKNDGEAIKGMRMCLKNEGYIMLTIPSKYSFFLYGFHGYRRYSISKITRLANENGLYVREAIKIGGLTSFLLHFILWTIPGVLLRIKIWEIYKKSKFLINSIAKLERLSLSFDKTFCLLEGGYAIVLKKEGELS
jgi:ubiquinone/menaquinone biosynthesis C-methylase UbiE